jgi:hypothetical protein
MKKLIIVLGLTMLAGTIFASVPLFQGRYTISGITGDTNVGWRVIGKFEDSSLLGYGASDASIGDVIFSYSSFGDADEFRITNIVSVTGLNLTVDVIYNEVGIPRAGAPQPGEQIMCRKTTNGLAYLPSLSFDSYPEYLQNSARNLNLKYALTNATGGGGSGGGDVYKGSNNTFANGTVQTIPEIVANKIVVRQGTNVSYSPSVWTSVVNLPAGRSGLTTVTLSNNIYAIGGWQAVNAATNVYKFDGTNWTEVIGLPEARGDFSAVIFSNNIYAIGGSEDGFGSKTNVYRFNGSIWTEVMGLPKGMESLSATVFNNAIYTIGGYNYDEDIVETNVYRYNGLTWTEIVGLPASRGYTVADVIDGSMYVFSGYADFHVATNTYKFNGTTWTEVEGIPNARYKMASVVFDNNIYVIGGYGGDDLQKTNVYIFNGSSWTETMGLPIINAELAATTLGNDIYVIGGQGLKTNVCKLNFNLSPAIIQQWKDSSDNLLGEIYQDSNVLYGVTYLDSVASSNYVIKSSAEQILDNGDTIQYAGNVKISTTNTLITLGMPQLQTSGVPEGAVCFLRGGATTGGILFTNGSGIKLDCKLSFFFTTNDVLEFMYGDGVWNELRRMDRH